MEVRYVQFDQLVPGLAEAAYVVGYQLLLFVYPVVNYGQVLDEGAVVHAGGHLLQGQEGTDTSHYELAQCFEQSGEELLAGR